MGSKRITKSDGLLGEWQVKEYFDALSSLSLAFLYPGLKNYSHP